MVRRYNIKPAALLKHFAGISRLLAGQLDFQSAIHAVAVEIKRFLPHDHLDVCIIQPGGKYHATYETGLSTAWQVLTKAPLTRSPIRGVLLGKEEFILTPDASTDPRFHFRGAYDQPIFEQGLRSRIHVPMKVQGTVIGALNLSCHEAGVYTPHDIKNAQMVADLLSPYFFALRAARQAQQSAIVEAEARVREEGLRQGARTLTEELERERQRIGMDLHDQTLADLTRLARQIEALGRRPDLAQQVEPIARHLQQCMHELRHIIEQATPSVLRLFGFAHAVENHLASAIRNSGDQIASLLEDSAPQLLDHLDETVAIALFRIAQEAINNAVSHSLCRTLQVSLGQELDRFVIRVEDDGQGLGQAAHRPGHGLDNMLTRAQLIGADLSIGAGIRGRGTRIEIRLPLPPGAAIRAKPEPATEHA